ncbi:MAG: hypothetical protein M3403_04545 [Gemmatimonadota bacterium]|nr:hypothetical protein [Gemmatimonadota bacterium]
MTELGAASLVLGATLAWFALAFLPALHELLRPTDISALRVVHEYNRDIKHFANRFRALIAQHVDDRAAAESEERREIILPNGSPLLIIPGGSTSAPLPPQALGEMHTGEWAALERGGTPAAQGSMIIAAYRPLDIASGMVVFADVFTSHGLRTGRGSVVRAALALSHIRLGSGSVVLRWIHSDQSLTAGTDCRLYGRASADDRMLLSEGCTFQRIHAPVIGFGSWASEGYQPEPARRPFKARPWFRRGYGRIIVTDDLTIPARTVLTEDLIVTGELLVERDVHIIGSVKADGSARLQERVRVDGSLITGDSLYLGEFCRVRGPLVAERNMVLAASVALGTIDQPVSVTAERIFVGAGARAFGLVWAREMGQVINSEMAGHVAETAGHVT